MKLCDIYGWKTTMSAEYLNNKEGEIKLAHWKNNGQIAKVILKTKEQNGALTQKEDKIIEGPKSFKKRINGTN